MLPYIFLVLFVLDSLLHLYSRLARRVKLKKVTKALLLLLLLGWYVTAASFVQPLVVVALLFSWAGDVLLIPDSLVCFVAGGVSFVVSHVCFIFAYLPHVDFSLVGWEIQLSTVLFYALLVVLIFRWLRPHLKKQLYLPMKIYLFVNGVMNCVALWQHMSIASMASGIAYLGALLFFISDSILFYVRFVDKYKHCSHFCVMLTYLGGEFLIVLGMMLLGYPGMGR